MVRQQLIPNLPMKMKNKQELEVLLPFTTKWSPVSTGNQNRSPYVLCEQETGGQEIPVTLNLATSMIEAHEKSPARMSGILVASPAGYISFTHQNKQERVFVGGPELIIPSSCISQEEL